MIKQFLLGLFLLIPSLGKAEVLTLDQILESTCRVQSGNAYGTGSCIDFEKDKYYILTNAHVVGSNSTAKLEFFKNGRKTLPIPGKVVFHKLIESTEVDFALIEVDAKYFGKYPPRIAAIAPRNAEPVDNYMKTVGCPGARWPSGLEGFVISYSGPSIKFYPAPIGGQSGSGLYILAKVNDELQTVLKGIVTWRIGGQLENKNESQGYESAIGGAVNIDKVKDVLSGNVAYEKVKKLPKNYIPVNTTIIPDPYWVGHYAYATDHKYYRIGRNQYGEPQVNTPPNVSIVSYGVLPVSDLLPIPDSDEPGPPPAENPYDNLPNLDNDTPPVPDKQVQELKTKLAQAESEKATLVKSLDEKTKEAGDLAAKVTKLEEDYKVLSSNSSDEYNKLATRIKDTEAQLIEKQQLISDITQNLAKKDAEIDSLKESFATIQKEMNLAISVRDEKIKSLENSALGATKDAENAQKEVAEVKEEKQEVAATASTYGWLSTFLGSGVVASLGVYFSHYLVLRKKVKAAILQAGQILDKGEEGIESILGSTLKEVTTQVKQEKLEKEKAAQKEEMAATLKILAEKLQSNAKS